MRKFQLLILLAFIALFGAGAVSALVADRYVRHHPGSGGGDSGGNHRDNGPESMLVRELGLTKEQHEQMAKIWSDAREKSRANWDSQRPLRQQRDDEIKAMLTPEQRKQLDAITARFEAAQAKIRDENDALMKQAEAKTREILTEAQRPKYEEFLKRARDRNDRRGPGSRPGNSGGPQGGPPPGGPFGGPGGPPPMGGPVGGSVGGASRSASMGDAQRLPPGASSRPSADAPRP